MAIRLRYSTVDFGFGYGNHSRWTKSTFVVLCDAVHGIIPDLAATRRLLRFRIPGFRHQVFDKDTAFSHRFYIRSDHGECTCPNFFHSQGARCILTKNSLDAEVRARSSCCLQVECSDSAKELPIMIDAALDIADALRS